MSAGSCMLEIPADHPAFAGHFPDHPIVPGVVLVDAAARAIAAAFGLGEPCWQIGSVKFVRPVGPGEALRLSWKAPAASGAIALSIDTAGQPVASGTLTPRPPVGRDSA
ncbi:MAG: hypothetical protein Q7J47_06830 [Azoarcus sp.]|nr:hypothetical protein [Azoarcus sp.]